MIAAENHTGNWWTEYLSLLQDPAHLLLELTLILVVDVLIGMIAWPLVKRAIARHDYNKHGRCEHEETHQTLWHGGKG